MIGWTYPICTYNYMQRGDSKLPLTQTNRSLTHERMMHELVRSAHQVRRSQLRVCQTSAKYFSFSFVRLF